MRALALFVPGLLFACSMQAQDLPSLPSGSPPGITRLSPVHALQQDIAHAQTSYGHALGFLSVSSFGLSGRGYFSLGDRGTITTEISTGFFRANSSLIADTWLGGYRYAQGFFILPAYFGIRYNLFEGRAGTMNWSHFVRGGAGPAVGMLTPVGLGFLESIDRTSFHWGVGTYAMTGFEFVFDRTYSVFLQGGVDYNHFFTGVGGPMEFAGPSFAIGFGKLLP